MDITVKNLQKTIPIHPQVLIRAATQALKKLKLNLNSLSVVCVGATRMRRINKTYLGHDYVTDVITFHHGEIIICAQEAKRNASAHGTHIDEEILLYVIHGILHLAGYDDHTPKDIEQMRQKEKELMKSIRG